MDMALTQAKESVKRALDGLDDTEYAEFKNTVNMQLDEMYNQFKILQESTMPVTDSIVATITEATAEFYDSFIEDMKSLNTEIEPMRAHLRETIIRHLTQYREKMEPIIRDLHATHKAEMERMRIRVEPLVDEMKVLVNANVEETKAALMPIVEAVRTRLSTHLENLKKVLTPYAEEYKDQINGVWDQARNIDASEITALKIKIEPMAEDIKTKFNEIIEAITAMVNKNNEGN